MVTVVTFVAHQDTVLVVLATALPATTLFTFPDQVPLTLFTVHLCRVLRHLVDLEICSPAAFGLFNFDDHGFASSS